MAFFQIFFYLICIAGIVLMGISFECLSCNNAGRKDISVPDVILMGAAQIILLSYWLSYFGISMKRIVYIIGAFCFMLWIAVIRKKQIHFQSFAGVENKLIVFVCVSAGALALIPMVVYRASFPYGDGYTYLCIADYLTEYGYRETAELNPHYPWLTQMALYQIQHLRIGAQMLLSFWTAALRQEFSILTYAPVSGLGVALYGSAVWLYSKNMKSSDTRTNIYAVVFSAFNVPIIIWSAIFGFFPQLFGLVYMVAALGSMLPIMKNTRQLSLGNIWHAAVYIAVMALCYSEIVPFFVLLIVVMLVYLCVKNKVFFKIFKPVCMAGLMSGVLLGEYMIRMIYAVASQFGAVVGGEQTINWLGYIGYMLSSVPVGFNFKEAFDGSLKFLCAITTLGMLVLLTVGIVRSNKKDRQERLLETCLMSLPYFIMLVYFSCIADNPFGTGTGNSWGIYKLVQYYFVVPCCGLFPFYADTFRGKSKVLKALSAIFFSGFVCVAVINTVSYSGNITKSMYEYVGNTSHPIEEYLKLADLYKDETRVINLVGIPDTPRKMVTYFLRNNKLSSNWSSDGYFGIYGENMDPSYDMDGITLKYLPQDEAAVAGLCRVDASFVDVRSGAGVGVGETAENEGSWSWNDTESEYTILNYTKQSNVRVTFEASCTDNGSDNILDVYMSDKLLLSQNINAVEKKKFELELFIESGESADIRLEYRGKKSAASLSDSRELVVCVWNISAYGE